MQHYSALNQTMHWMGDGANGSKCGLVWTRSLSTTPHRLPFTPSLHCLPSRMQAPTPFPTSSNSHRPNSPRAPSPDSPLLPMAPSQQPSPPSPDCWTLDETSTLIEAWGERHLDLNRGSFLHKHWQEVADAVNSSHGYKIKSIRTAIQCKHRIDSLKRKYKIEKVRVRDSGGTYVCAWPFFSCLNEFLGNSHMYSPPADVSNFKPSPATTLGLSLFSKVPVGPRSKKRRSTHVYRSFFDSHLFRNVNSKEDEGNDGMDFENLESKSRFKYRDEGFRKLADAIRTITDVYERVEMEKQRLVVELEMQRMQFVKDLEYQRMQLFMEMHLQMHKIKRARRASSADYYS